MAPIRTSIPSRNQIPTVLEKRLDRFFVLATRICALGIWLILVAIVLAILIQSFPAIHAFRWQFLITQEWNPVSGREIYGVLPMIYGTLMTSAIALVITIPLGVGTAIFLNEDFLPESLREPLTFLVELLAAIPSVIYGLWGIFVVIPIIKDLGNQLYEYLGWFPLLSTPSIGPGILPAGIVLAIMILPITTVLSRESLAAVPSDLRQAAMGLGASRWETILRVLLPAAFSGVVAAVMLALGRAMGETMATTMIIGNSNALNLSLLAPGNTIASLLANQFAEAKGLQVSALMYAALVLVGMTLIVNIIAQRIVRQVSLKNR